MCVQRFASSVLILLLYVPGEENSLLSRFRNPNQFVASEEEAFLAPEDLDEDLYSDVVREVPQLKEYWKRERDRDPIVMPYLKEQPSPGDYGVEYDGDDEVNATRPRLRMSPRNSTAATALRPRSSTAAPGAGAPPQSTSLSPSSPMNDSLAASLPLNDTRRKWWELHKFYWYFGDYTGSCYRCGLYESGIPVSPICHDAWDSDDWRAKTMARYFMAKCYYNWRYWKERPQPGQKLWNEFWDRTSDKGLIWEYYGLYVDGCFKRWTDVGKVYTTRGCRAHPPLLGNSFVGHRFRRLELTLRYKEDACVHSPQASLTPFARGISLFVRYHVCVCNTKYCNRSTALTHTHLLVLMLLYVLFV